MKKSPGKASFKQPSHGGSAPMPKGVGKMGDVAPKMKKVKAPGKVNPPAGGFKSTEQLTAFRKGKYGV